MDPFLERHWEDVHTTLITYIRDILQPQLADDLIARSEEKVYVEDDGATRLRKPDVRVVENPTSWSPEPGAIGTAVIDEPMLLEPVGDPIRERSILIYDSVGNRIVTAIEILSPWNKSPGNAVNAYLEKRNKYINSEMNLVEIDLIRTGDWTAMIGPYQVPKKGLTTYRVTVVRPEVHSPLHYPIWLRAKLPTIKIPLRPQDPPAILSLQEVIDKVYIMGKYYRIDYTQTCSPPLIGPEKIWADEVLAGAGMR